MQPDAQSVHVDAVLSNISIGFSNRAYVGDRLYPTVTVQKQSDKYYEFHKGAWFRDEAKVRAPGARSAQGGWTVTTGSYFCNEYAFSKKIPDEVRDNADTVMAPDRTATNFVTDKIVLSFERRIAAQVLAQTNGVTTVEDVAGLWAASGTVGTNTFINDIENGKTTIEELTGLSPNVLLIDVKTYRQLKQDATILDRIKYTQRGVITAQLIASLLDLDEIIIGRAILSDAEEASDGSDFNAVNIWAKNQVTSSTVAGNGLLFYRTPAPALETPTLGYNFSWMKRSVRRWREDPIKSDFIEASQNHDQKMVSPACGLLFWDTIASTD